MATKEKPKPHAILSINYNKYLLPFDEAVLVFKALQECECVEEKWDGVSNKTNLVRKEAPEITLKLVSPSMVACMVLEE